MAKKKAPKKAAPKKAAKKTPKLMKGPKAKSLPKWFGKIAAGKTFTKAELDRVAKMGPDEQDSFVRGLGGKGLKGMRTRSKKQGGAGEGKG